MAAEANKTAIGAFVLGAIALLVAVLLLLGGGRLFRKEHLFITYFDGSVKGLSVGSPVMFRGVKVGSVTDIRIVVDPTGRDLKIPVVFTLEPDSFEGAKAETVRNEKTIHKAVIEYGLRTQLQSMSFLTGQLMVSLDFFHGKPARFVGLSKKYPEIPSVPTPLEELQRTIERLPLKEMADRLNGTLDGIERLVTSLNNGGAVQDMTAAIRDIRTMVRHVDESVGPVARSLERTAGSADAAMKETKETMAHARGNMKELTGAAKETLETARAALRQADGTLKQAEGTLRTFSGDSRLAADTSRALREISATARSLRQLADYLERHPESLLRGKPEGD